MTYSLLLYGPHSYTYIALITFIRLSLLEHLVRACTGASSYKPYLVTAYKPVVTSLSRYRTESPSLPVVTQQSFLVTGSSLQPYMAPPYRSVVTASLQAISLQVGPRYPSLHNRVISLPDCSLPLISPSLPLADRRYTLYGCRYG